MNACRAKSDQTQAGLRYQTEMAGMTVRAFPGRQGNLTV